MKDAYSDIVKRYEFDTAEDFFHALLPTSDIWSFNKLDEFIFRGHADADWKLTPSALRTPKKVIEQQKIRELNSLRLFFDEADRQGINIPGDSLQCRQYWNEVSECKITYECFRENQNDNAFIKILNMWPPRELWEVLALAQHYGIQTRLLDWTSHPMVAAYFAAIGAMQRLENEWDSKKRLCVWACNKKILEITDLLPEEFQFLHLIHVRRSGNPNLHAQHGVFTLQTKLGEAFSLISENAFEDAIHFIMAFIEKGQLFFDYVAGKIQSPMRFLSLPVTEAGKLLGYLDNLGYSGTALFPGYAGAARAVREKELRARIEDLQTKDEVFSTDGLT